MFCPDSSSSWSSAAYGAAYGALNAFSSWPFAVWSALPCHAFLCRLAKFRAASTLPKPQAFSARAFLVGRPLSSFIGPFIPANLAANETRRGEVPDDNGRRRLEPSLRLKCLRPASFRPPSGFWKRLATIRLSCRFLLAKLFLCFLTKSCRLAVHLAGHRPLGSVHLPAPYSVGYE